MMGDFIDIHKHDWPAVRAGLKSGLYGEHDPVPVDVDDLSEIVAARPLGRVMELWQPPRVDGLIIATTGRFTVDAISLMERHNQGDHALHIGTWPDSHLEVLLAARPHLIAEFRLRDETLK